MTRAVCFNCGEIKWGALGNCKACGARPQSDDDLMLALALTDHYLDKAGLQKFASNIKAGNRPKLSESLRQQFAPAILEARRIGISSSAESKAMPVQTNSSPYGPSVQDYYDLLANAVSKLEHNSYTARQKIYENARITLGALLRKQSPSFSEAEVDRHNVALESAIRQLEAETSPKQLQAPPSSAQKKNHLDLNQNAITKAANYAARAFASAGVMLFALAIFVGMILASGLYIWGLVWVSDHTIEYLVPLAAIVILVSIFIVLPLGAFRKTRPLSAIGLVAASYLFGLTTWILGFLTTLQYWGGAGLAIGLILGVIGVVPLGIMASAVHSDWWSATVLILGLFLTYGSRAIGIVLEAK